MKIGLLECDHVAEGYRRIAGDYREMFADLLDRYAPHLSLDPFDVCNGELPASLDASDAYLCTGSRYSVSDDADWIRSLGDFVRRLSEAGKPFVGICFGHQMLAQALGGEVRRSARGWGVGVHQVEITRAEAWMQPPLLSCKLQFMHQDQVERLPGNGVLLGQSDHCPVSIFRAGHKMLGIQGHPEFTAAYSEALLSDRRERIGAERVTTALASLDQRTDQEVIADWIAEFFKRTA